MYVEVTCEWCNGSGEGSMVFLVCYNCNGDGTVFVEEKKEEIEEDSEE